MRFNHFAVENKNWNVTQDKRFFSPLLLRHRVNISSVDRWSRFASDLWQASAMRTAYKTWNKAAWSYASQPKATFLLNFLLYFSCLCSESAYDDAPIFISFAQSSKRRTEQNETHFASKHEYWTATTTANRPKVNNFSAHKMHSKMANRKKTMREKTTANERSERST